MRSQLLAVLSILGLALYSINDPQPALSKPSDKNSPGEPSPWIAWGPAGDSEIEAPRGPGQGSKHAGRKVGLIKNGEAAFKGYTLLTPLMSDTTYLIDNEGRVVHSWKTDYPGLCSYLLENGHLLLLAGPAGFGGNGTFHGGGAAERVMELAWDGTVIWDFKYSSDKYLLHHDIEPMPDGNVLMIAWERKTAQETIAAGRDPEVQGEGDLWPDHIIEVKPTGKTTGEIVWEWHVWDHLVQDIDPSKPSYGAIEEHPELININPIDWVAQLSPAQLRNLQTLGYLRGPTKRGPRRTHPDWNHINGISYNSELDQIALSVLGFNEVWIIDHSTTKEGAAGHSGGRCGRGGDLIYRWGNPMAYGAGTPDDQQLFAQHDATWVKRGESWCLLIFNNGRGRPEGDYSSVDEIVLPVDRRGRYRLEPGSAYGPQEPVWSYTAPEESEFFSGHISGAQRLPNGNTLICLGATGTIFEVTREGEIVWKYINPFESKGPPPRGIPPGLDSDGDGQVSYKEASRLPFMNEDVFKRLDANGNGALSEDEFAQAPPPPGVLFMPPPGPGMAGPPPGMPFAGPPGPGMGGPPPGGPGMAGPISRRMVFKVRRYAPDYPGLPAGY